MHSMREESCVRGDDGVLSGLLPLSYPRTGNPHVHPQARFRTKQIAFHGEGQEEVPCFMAAAKCARGPKWAQAR